LGYLAYPGYPILELSRFAQVTRLLGYLDYLGYPATFLALLSHGHSTLPGVTCHFSHRTPCNNENKIDVMSCILIGLILLKIGKPKNHVMVHQGFPMVQDTLPSGDTWPQVHPITKSQGMESQIPVWVQLRI
jgi:hypothetical protein